MKKELNILTAVVVVWCCGIIAVPIFSGSAISDILFRFYSVVCHQFDSRSFHIHGSQFAVCIRCSSIYGGFLGTLILLQWSAQLRLTHFRPLRVLLVCSLPMLLDGLLSFLQSYEPTTISRMITGSLFGAGMALLLHNSLTDIIHMLLQRWKHYELKTR